MGRYRLIIRSLYDVWASYALFGHHMGDRSRSHGEGNMVLVAWRASNKILHGSEKSRKDGCKHYLSVTAFVYNGCAVLTLGYIKTSADPTFLIKEFPNHGARCSFPIPGYMRVFNFLDAWPIARIPLVYSGCACPTIPIGCFDYALQLVCSKFVHMGTSRL